MSQLLVGPNGKQFHKRTIYRGDRLSISLINSATGWLASLVAITLAVFLVAVIIVDGGGRRSEEHKSHIPAGVQMVPGNADQYLIPNNVKVLPAEICLGSRSGYAPIDSVTPLEKYNATLVTCNKAQSWNSKRADSPNFSSSLGRVASSAPFIGIFGGLFAVWFLSFFFPALSDFRASGKANKHVKMSLEKQRELLTTAWAKGDIEQEDFERKLDTIIAQESSL